MIFCIHTLFENLHFRKHPSGKAAATEKRGRQPQPRPPWHCSRSECSQTEDDLLAICLAGPEDSRREVRMVHRIGIVLALDRNAGIILIAAARLGDRTPTGKPVARIDHGAGLRRQHLDLTARSPAAQRAGRRRGPSAAGGSVPGLSLPIPPCSLLFGKRFYPPRRHGAAKPYTPQGLFTKNHKKAPALRASIRNQGRKSSQRVEFLDTLQRGQQPRTAIA